MIDITDPRSTVGRYLRGNNVYNGTGSSPNPTGLNQYPTNLQRAAAMKRKKLTAKRLASPFPDQLLTDRGGLYQ